MPREIKYLLNKTQGEEHDLPCVKCTGKTAHKVFASMDVRGSEGDGGYSFDWSTDYQIVQFQARNESFRHRWSASRKVGVLNEPSDKLR